MKIIFMMCLLISFLGCSKDLQTEGQVTGDPVTSGIIQDEKMVEEAKTVEEEKEIEEPSLLEQGEWNLDALVEFDSLVLLQFRVGEYEGFFANLFIEEDYSYMQNDSEPNTFSDLELEFREDALVIHVNETRYKSKLDKQNNINAEFNSFSFIIPKGLFLEAVFESEESVYNIRLNCFFSNNDGQYSIIRIESI